MTKILIAILLITTGLKMTAAQDIFAGKYRIGHFSAQDEEGPNEQGDHENGKTDNKESLYTFCPVSYFIFDSSAKFLSPLRHQPLYCRFNARPSTPPPDLS